MRLLSLVREDLFFCIIDIIATFSSVLRVPLVVFILEFVLEFVYLIDIFVFTSTDISKGYDLLLLRGLFYRDVVLDYVCKVTLLTCLRNTEQLG